MLKLAKKEDLVPIKSKDLRVGDIVRIEDGGAIPADMVILSSSYPNGSCYITTANLDGYHLLFYAKTR